MKAVGARSPWNPFRLVARGVALAFALALPGPAAAQTIPEPVCHIGAAPFPSIASCRPAPVAGGWSAEYGAGTTDYTHAVLGDGIEWRRLSLRHQGQFWEMTLPNSRVFEDVAPRLADRTGDGRPEVIVVETSRAEGGSLAVYAIVGDDALTRIATTGYIGRTNRWLAPVGIADLDGDGTVEIAYVDRPHLARTLRVWRFQPSGAGGDLVELAAVGGLTNHRIGEPFITGGIRDCGQGPEMITADTDWRRILATRLSSGGMLAARDLGSFSQDAVRAALACRL
ncbi:MAG: VCBS repeat-containing protein [Pseudomonadota bacterium]